MGTEVPIFYFYCTNCTGLINSRLLTHFCGKADNTQSEVTSA